VAAPARSTLCALEDETRAGGGGIPMAKERALLQDPMPLIGGALREAALETGAGRPGPARSP